ncbi:MAG: hypothetical protein ABSG77_15620 [Candidatus Acidiferrum sp.]
MGPETNAPDLPPYSLGVQALELGADTRAVGLELLETQSREPLRGSAAAPIWAAAFSALAAKEMLLLDFFSHVERAREFCNTHAIAYREAAPRCLVVPCLSTEQLRQLFARFEAETFGMRAGPAAQNADAALENKLSLRGLDAYQTAYTRYTFCAVVEPEDAWVTLLSEGLWPSEVIRRVRPALQPFDVYIARPQ